MIDNDPIAHTGQLAFVAHPASACQIDISRTLRPQVPPHGILSNDPQKATSHINRQLTIALCTLCIFVLVVRTVSVLFRLSVSCEAKGTLGTTPRGRRNDTIAAPPLLKNQLEAQDQTPANINGIDVCGRGKQPSAKEYAPATISHVAQAGAQSTVSCGDTNAHLSSITQEPEVSRIAASQRGLSNPVHQASPPIVEPTWPSLLQTSYYPIAYFLGRFTSAVLAEFLWPSTGFSSYGRIPPVPRRSRLLPSLYGRRPTLFLLVIAVQDAIRDLQVLDNALSDLNPESIRFTRLSGSITLEDIDVELKKLCEESKEVPDSQILVLLTGHGEEHNRMILPGAKSVDAPYLFRLLESYHVGKTPVTILFDVCRPGGCPGPEPPEGISLIWTCSSGEWAGSYRFPHGPNSTFLTALMMASREGPGRINEPPQDAIQMQLNLMMEYLKRRYAVEHSNGRCRRCILNRCYEPTAQNIDWKYARNADGLVTLMESLSDTKVADGVHRWFRANYFFAQPIASLSQGPSGTVCGTESSGLVHQTSAETRMVADGGLDLALHSKKRRECIVRWATRLHANNRLA